ncbi:MerR family transcriptional regulator [Streptomyces sp. NPDC047981]|uniref:MerR family transcriptional regulator n=1 Tax=Streptomyces sp. NPDC047981 TaxID=3154610 RepID=UPI00341B57D0
MGDGTTGITTGAVARRLGVSPTTLRSWDQRYGIGPAARENGRHRRWTPADVAVLEAMCRLTTSGVPPAEAARLARTGTGSPAAEPAATTPAPTRAPGSGNGLPLADVRQEFRGLARAAVRLDSPAMDTLLRGLLATHGLVTSWEEVMGPTLHAVGRKWESSGDRYVEVEHLLSWHISTALRRTADTAPPHRADAPPVLLACVPGEQHTLPLEALTAGLTERALPTRMFGASVPAEALGSAVGRLGPLAVVLWSQSRSTAAHALARHVADTSFGVRGARTRPLVLLAGPGWAGRAPAPGMLRPTGLREALDVLTHRYTDLPLLPDRP